MTAGGLSKQVLYRAPWGVSSFCIYPFFLGGGGGGGGGGDPDSSHVQAYKRSGLVQS